MGIFMAKIPERKDDIDRMLTELNFNRTKILAGILFLVNLLLLYSDYVNKVHGLWILPNGYKSLFYSHVVLGLGTMLAIFVSYLIKSYFGNEINWFHRLYINVFAFFILNLAAVISGWVDQNIHGQISVYVMACFVIAIIYYQKPRITGLLYVSSFCAFMVLVSKSQNDMSIRVGHYVNASISVIIAFILSALIHKLMQSDLALRYSLEAQVTERTKELQSANNLLKQEISERKRADEKVLRLASIVESSNDGIIGMSPEGIVIDWNYAAQRILGFTQEEMIGRHIRELVSEEKYTQLGKILSELNSGKRVSLFETEILRRDSKIANVALTVSPIVNTHGNIVGYSTIVIELTEKKRLEEEIARLDRLNLVGEMDACICHEVRNPMTTVKGFLQLTRNKQDHKIKEFFDLMIMEMDRANSILSEFLSISRTKVTIFEQGNLNDIINSILPLVQADAINNEKLVTAELSNIPDLQLNVTEIRQLVLNLVRNGFEAMSTGGKLNITTFTTEKEVVLAVTDEGVGIEPHVLEKLGTPFFTTKLDGTGLGLAVCEGIISRHNARLKVETSDKGSTFYVYFNTSSADQVGIA
ncbi:MAG TPA: PAS domain S-box protein [Candidatus Deferrimicrobium sp.]|nr:PAS domain S-box protein [Candidatus Deferrimicrobium sp.]